MRKTGARNSDFDWNAWEPDKYNEQYLNGILWEDRVLDRFTLGALRELGVPLNSQPVGIDICNGGVLRGPAILAPLVSETLIWADYGEPQVARADEIIANGKRGDLGGWAVQQAHLEKCDPVWSSAAQRSCEIGVAQKLSIFELPEENYDVGSMLFGAESLTSDKREWEMAMEAFYRSIKPEGASVMFFMERSKGYASAGRAYPGADINLENALVMADKFLTQSQVFYAPVQNLRTVRPSGNDHGFSGMGGIVGLRKTDLI